MKIERLSENSIRCTLNRADLDSRELKISELAYGTEKAKSLFKDMIAQASFECGFEAEDIPLMIEAIPVSPDCIVLVITKVEDPEELDTRFSKFAPSDDDDDYADMLDDDEVDVDDGSSLLKRINDALNQGQDFIPFSDSFGRSGQKACGKGDTKNGSDPNNVSGIGASQSALSGASDKKAAGKDNTAGQTAQDALVPLERLFSFKDLSHASTAAAAIQNRFTGDSALYKNPVSQRYYLFISSEKMNSDEFTGVSNTLSEYGAKEKLSYATLAYLGEHDEVIIRKDAVKVLSTL